MSHDVGNQPMEDAVIARNAVVRSTIGALEVKTGDRRALRRAVRMSCDVLASDYDDTVSHMLTDLSPFGAWIETIYPLDPGVELLVSLTPPAAIDRSQDVVLAGRVARSSLGRRRAEDGRSGMGVAFEASDLERAQLSAALRGLPPPLPARGAITSAIEWVDVPVVYEEEYEHGTNIFSMMETVACFFDEADALFELDEQALVAQGPLLTGGARWRIALA